MFEPDVAAEASLVRAFKKLITVHATTVVRVLMYRRALDAQRSTLLCPAKLHDPAAVSCNPALLPIIVLC
jgi:hypothetical protein